MVPEGGREELVARGEEEKPPRGQSISVSGKWRVGGGDAGERGGRRRVKRKGETEACEGSIEAVEMSRASGEMRNGVRGAEMERW